MAENTPTPAELVEEARNHVEHFPLSDGDALRVGRLADALETVTADRDALAAVIEEARAAYGRGIELGDEGTDHYLDPEATLDSMWQSIDTAPATVLAQRDARVLREAAEDMDNTDDPDAIYVANGDIDVWLRVQAERIEREAQR